MQEIAPGITVMDTLLGGMEGITAAYLVAGPRPALVETGARTSAATVREALAGLGLGPDDLAWIVLTHIHLDHCGGTGILASAFPRATVVVHRRGARHLAEPERLVAATAAVHGPRWSLYGGLDRTPAGRIAAAEDGHRVSVGPGRDLVMMETTGHARHHMSVHDDATGTVMAGDAAGARLAGGGMYPTMPPPDVDLAAADASIARLAALRPQVLCLGHCGPVADPDGDLALAREHVGRLGAAAAAGGRDRAALARELDRTLPFAEAVPEEASRRRWARLGWSDQTVDGLAARREAE